MPTIYIQDPVHNDAIEELLEHGAEVVLGYGDSARPLNTVIGRVNGLLLRTRPLGAELIEAGTNLKAIARMGVGFDNIDVSAATRAGVRVLITPNANYRSVAEHVFALLLGVRRRIIHYDRVVREARFEQRDAELLYDLGGTTLGIFGLGRIGREVARIARHGFGMHVLAYDPFVDQSVPELVADVDTLLSSPDEVLQRSDAISLHMPRTPQTEGFIAQHELELLPAHAIVINTARGGIIDEGALHDAIVDGTIAGAGLDVFASEPPPADLPLLGLDRVVLSPHNAGLTHRSVRDMGLAAAGGLLSVIQGVPMGGALDDWLVVNPEAFDS